jgi:hypothetical protein
MVRGGDAREVRGPAQDNPAEIDTIQSFVRIYPGPSTSVMAGADGDPFHHLEW